MKNVIIFLYENDLIEKNFNVQMNAYTHDKLVLLQIDRFSITNLILRQFFLYEIDLIEKNFNVQMNAYTHDKLVLLQIDRFSITNLILRQI